jgi:MFS family permease
MALRFLLGAAEAGVYPGIIIFQLLVWPRKRAIRIAVFFCNATLAGAFGGMSISMFELYNTHR